MEIPDFIWFAVRAAALAGCLLWHKRSPSPHLPTVAAGLGLLILLTLPSVFRDMFGMDQFEEQASRFIDAEPDTAHYTGRTSGTLLLDRCLLFEWIGLAFLALGITRLSRQIADPALPVR